MTDHPIVRAARGWLGTPYRHQGSCRGAGCDCLGLVRGVWRELYGAEPELPPAYTPDWGEVGGGEPLLTAAGRHLRPVPEPRPGDVLLFRMVARGPAKHAGILSGEEMMIHAYSGHGVVETPLGPAWTRRLAAGFRFPEIG
ncbi:MAG: NlpC/P60 family protein [Pseudomonadota bacterium]